jgi:DNA-binding response OmpR family regulator
MKIILLTAHRDEEVNLRLRNMGVAEVLFKPVDPQDLASKVGLVLGEG